MREIKFSFIFQHYETGRFVERIRSLEDIAEKGYPDEGLGGYTFVSQRQYTGLIDKNGAEIYEGDIVKAVRHTDNFFFINEVTYKAPYFYIKGNASLWQMDKYELEVIGNVYENQELLAKKP